MRLTILVLILASVLLLGCTSPPPEQNVTNQTNQTGPGLVKTPSFSITAPSASQVVSVDGDTGSVTVTFSTKDLVLRKAGGVAKKGEGYFKVSVDGKAAVAVSAKTYQMADLSLGKHTVSVELVNNDGTSYSPKITKSVTFTVEKTKPVEYVPQTYNVSITNSAYDPASITVKVGDSVTFTNNANAPQSATCFIEGKQVFDTNILATGKSATITVTQVMECEYYSTLFRMMKGNIVVQSNGTAAATSSAASTDLKDCGTSLQCFSNAAGSCTPAKVNYTMTAFTISTTTYMEIRSMTNGKCDFFVRRDKVTSAGADAETQALYAATEGKTGTCSFEPGRLAQVMNNWQQGKISTSDWDGSNCQGTYFSG